MPNPRKAYEAIDEAHISEAFERGYAAGIANGDAYRSALAELVAAERRRRIGGGSIKAQGLARMHFDAAWAAALALITEKEVE